MTITMITVIIPIKIIEIIPLIIAMIIGTNALYNTTTVNLPLPLLSIASQTGRCTPESNHGAEAKGFQCLHVRSLGFLKDSTIRENLIVRRGFHDHM